MRSEFILHLSPVPVPLEPDFLLLKRTSPNKLWLPVTIAVLYYTRMRDGKCDQRSNRTVSNEAI